MSLGPHLSTSVRVEPRSRYSAVCLAFGRGFLDDPEQVPGLAHLVEHLWFTEAFGAAAAPTVGRGSAGENCVLLTHLCPPEDVPEVLEAVGRRLGAWSAADPGNLAGDVDAVIRLIGLERRGVGVNPGSGALRRVIVQAVRADPDFDVNAVDTGSIGAVGLGEAITRWFDGYPVAVSVVGPGALSAPRVREALTARARLPRDTRDRSGVAAAPRLRGTWSAPDGTVAAAWLLEPAASTRAAVRVLAELLATSGWVAPLRWASGRILSDRGVAVLRDGLLVALGAGVIDGAIAPSTAGLITDHVMPAVRRDGAVERSVERARARLDDVATVAARDATDLVLDRDHVAGEPDAGSRPVSAALHRVDVDAVLELLELLAAEPCAEFTAARELDG